MTFKAFPLVRQLRQLINRHGTSVCWVGEQAGISKVSIYNWDNRSSPNVESLDAVLRVLGYELAIINSATGEVVKTARRPVTTTENEMRSSPQ